MHTIEEVFHKLSNKFLYIFINLQKNVFKLKGFTTYCKYHAFYSDTLCNRF